MHARLVSTIVLLGAILMPSHAAAQTAPANTVDPAARIYPVGDGFVRIEPVTNTIFRISFAKDKAFFDRSSYIIDPQGAAKTSAREGASITESGGAVAIATKDVTALLANGKLSFRDNASKAIVLAEADRTLDPAEVQGENTFHVRQQWESQPDEGLYGLGQHQFGLVNLKGYDMDLWQHNTEIAVPFLVSSKDYGILWDNPSFTKFGDPRDFEVIPPDHVFDVSGQPGGFTATPFAGSNWGAWNMGRAGTPRVEPSIDRTVAGAGGGRRGGNQETAMRWEGDVLADYTGAYQFKLYANGGYKMWIDDNLVADHWRQNWLPWDELVKVDFTGNTKHRLKIEWIKDGGAYCQLTWKTPLKRDADHTSLWSQVGQGIDYYFIYGGGEKPGAMDNVIAGYRQLTGKAPMMPIWAFGLWQSRQRYTTQQESIDVVKGFRSRQIPFDNIVQDWMYWPESQWGSHDFDPQRFPNPDQWVKDIHALNAHVMLSVWGKFYPGTDNYNAMQAKEYLYPIYPAKDWVGRGYNYTFYDAFNPGARDMFWDQVNKKLLSKGIDAWWMDATEPDLVQPSPPTLDKLQAGMPKTGAGTGASVMNAYPLLNSEAVYEGQRKAAPDQRVFILTRCGYAGEQRYAAAVWSGDISSTWTAMKKQIAAGLGYSVSGLPYWTMDSGGFSVPSKFWQNNQVPANARDEWNELSTRWLQFAAFVPLMRIHGENPHREMWEYGENSDAYNAQLKIDRLRYRLLPYIYSVAADVTQNDSTFMRPLVMDFPRDEKARSIADQYLFGPSFMVAPVYEYQARTRFVYLPSIPGGWYDFWSGRRSQSLPKAPMGNLLGLGNAVNNPAPYDEIPLHVRAGSILPLGPSLQYTTEKRDDPLTLLVYTGADGQFSLYEDDGLTYQYEKGAFARIPMTWNESTKTLTIGKRQGSFPAVLKERQVQVVFASATRPVPFAFDLKPDKTIAYTGDETRIQP